MFDIHRFLSDYGIPLPPEGHKHSRKGWINISCPFCSGNPGYHLGFNLTAEFWSCWRCGFKPFFTVIERLTGANNYSEIKRIYEDYNLGIRLDEQKKKSIYKRKECQLPKEIGALSIHHVNYLLKRNLDADKLKRIYDIKGISNKSSNLDWRIIVPIYHFGRLVSYQSRDITGRKKKLKYLACPSKDEAMPHKEIVFALDEAIKRDTEKVIVVEGVFDVFSLPVGWSVATFGIKYTHAQVNLLRQHFNKFLIWFDGEKQAQFQAKKLAETLQNLGAIASIVDPEGAGDPNDMNESERNKILKFFAKM